jgi:hypothetical protein
VPSGWPQSLALALAALVAWLTGSALPALGAQHAPAAPVSSDSEAAKVLGE